MLMRMIGLFNSKFIIGFFALGLLLSCSGESTKSDGSASASGKIKVSNSDFYRAITGLYLVKSGSPDWGGNWMASNSIPVGYEWQAPVYIGSWDVKVQWSDGESAILRNSSVSENQITVVHAMPGTYQSTLRVSNSYSMHIVQLYVIHSTSYNGSFPSINWVKSSSIPANSYYDLKVPGNGSYKVRSVWSNGLETTATSSNIPSGTLSTLSIHP